MYHIVIHINFTKPWPGSLRRCKGVNFLHDYAFCAPREKGLVFNDLIQNTTEEVGCANRKPDVLLMRKAVGLFNAPAAMTAFHATLLRDCNISRSAVEVRRF